MKNIIRMGLLALIMGCTTPPIPQAVVLPVTGPTVEELQAQVLEERRKLEHAQFEEYVNKETAEMMEFFSIEVKKLVLFKPVSLVISGDGQLGIAKCEVYMDGNMVGLAFVIAVNDGTGWTFLTVVNKGIGSPEETQ